jgi:hypothetical protein
MILGMSALHSKADMGQFLWQPSNVPSPPSDEKPRLLAIESNTVPLRQSDRLIHILGRASILA